MTAWLLARHQDGACCVSEMWNPLLEVESALQPQPSADRLDWPSQTRDSIHQLSQEISSASDKLPVLPFQDAVALRCGGGTRPSCKTPQGVLTGGSLSGWQDRCFWGTRSRMLQKLVLSCLVASTILVDKYTWNTDTLALLKRSKIADVSVSRLQ